MKSLRCLGLTVVVKPKESVLVVSETFVKPVCKDPLLHYLSSLCLSLLGSCMSLTEKFERPCGFTTLLHTRPQQSQVIRRKSPVKRIRHQKGLGSQMAVGQNQLQVPFWGWLPAVFVCARKVPRQLKATKKPQEVKVCSF